MEIGDTVKILKVPKFADGIISLSARTQAEIKALVGHEGTVVAIDVGGSILDGGDMVYVGLPPINRVVREGHDCPASRMHNVTTPGVWIEASRIEAV